MAERTNIEEVEQQAALFALGATSPEEAEAFKGRLDAGCPYCKTEVENCKRALSLLPLSTTPVAPPLRLRARLLASIKEQSSEPALPSAEMSLVRPQDTPWKSTSFQGVETRYLYKRKTMLVRMTADSRIPAHSHTTAEQCLVLEGSITSNGVTANAGDFVHMPAGSKHEDLYSSDGALLLITYA